ncbi:MAG: alpha/beta hydrolase fold domain-containing protein [Saprospiraceae bacterium]
MWFIQIIFLLQMISIPLEDAGQILPPRQAALGLGGADYRYHEIRTIDQSKRADGYWIFLPAEPMTEKANLILFNHGYGAYNPMIYGAWIKHLVRKGNVVIYPRYQKNLFWPWPSAFAKNAAKGIRNAIKVLETQPGMPKLAMDQVLMIGHSYGGVVSANLAIHAQKFGIPKVGGLMLCAPGTGPFTGGLLEEYSGMPADVKMVMIINKNDHIVSPEFQFMLFETAKNVQKKQLLLQRPDFHGTYPVTASHSECYAIDLDFDSGHRTPSAYRALGMGQADVVDYNVYWRIADGLLQDLKYPEAKSAVFGGHPEQLSLGKWSDGSPIVPLMQLK